MKVSKKQVQTAFSNAANTYDEAAVVQNEILERLLERLEILHQGDARVLDLGSGTGLARSQIQTRYGQEQYFAIDIAEKMLAYANAKFGSQQSVCGDVESLPYKENSFDLIFSASTLQWCNQIEMAFQEALRILKQNGLFMFSSFGPDTLKELRECFNKIDPGPHVNTFVDIHDLGDALTAIGFSDVVMESEIITVEYTDPIQILRDLQATGATNHLVDRSKGLLGKQSLNQLFEEYQKLKLENDKYPATFEVIYGHGWKKQLLKDKTSEWQPVQFQDL